MSGKDSTSEIIKLIENYLDSDNSDVELPFISQFMNENYFDAEKIREKFYILVEMYDSVKLRKILDLIEYLTLYSPVKLVEIISSEKFTE
mmetsp:Transcript_23056/g.20015  ORF Transcript_23056/g.20015 Transcript_23056/m.20015 type:complete len:90 (-) Transcript_23056:75-344(-)